VKGDRPTANHPFSLSGAAGMDKPKGQPKVNVDEADGVKRRHRVAESNGALRRRTIWQMGLPQALGFELQQDFG
jgi:hypothetical protein